jgi:hypothetical protein
LANGLEDPCRTQAWVLLYRDLQGHWEQGKWTVAGSILLTAPPPLLSPNPTPNHRVLQGSSRPLANDLQALNLEQMSIKGSKPAQAFSRRTHAWVLWDKAQPKPILIGS